MVSEAGGPRVPRGEWKDEASQRGIAASARAIAAKSASAEKKSGFAHAREEGEEGRAHRFAKDQLKAFVERIERLHEERKALSDDIRDIYAEAKGNGFDKKALAYVIRLRAQDVNERKEFDAIVETYLHALGMLA